MRVLGLISGTSADGIDVALVQIAGRPPRLRTRLEQFLTVPYPAEVRNAVLRLASGNATTTAEVSQLNFLLGELFAQAALRALRSFRVSPRQVHLIGSHGQTIYHQGTPARLLGTPVRATLQIGEPAVIAVRTGLPVVADFRPTDLAAGGQGAPLVPFVDFLCYRHPRRARVVLNIGGIANFTVLRAGARAEDVHAFDTGPGNMVVDTLVRRLTRGRQAFDRQARLAQRGKLLPDLLAELLRHPFFHQPPPKSAGREQFGAEFVEKILAWGRRNRARSEDLVRTATLLTPISILDAWRRWAEPLLGKRGPVDFIVSGGGVHNPLILSQLEAGLATRHGRPVRLLRSAALGMPEDAKEAFAFAVLAYESYHGRAANLPGATGARQAVVLGKLVPPGTR
ncbi:MAG: anhydro-N-acetylmuramic acid kinase [Firmicutes bacterium]|nr:anhydro-N-acetylmuramic acid kinase [Bacillota bacterium]